MYLPSWFPWPTKLRDIMCRFLISNYLGHFMQKKLKHEQLECDLYNGKVSIANVELDTVAINTILDDLHAPVEVLKGSLEIACITVPWKSLSTDSCTVEIKGVHVTAQPKYCANVDITNMSDSVFQSLKNMTTSMQIAQDCLNNFEIEETQDQPFEGLESCTRMFQSVVQRVKIIFSDITIHFEHIGPLSAYGVGLQVKIDHLDYFDEDSDLQSDGSSAQSRSKDAPVCEEVAFTCKQFKLFGVQFSTYQFASNTAITVKDLMTTPLPFAEFFGEQQIKIQIKQNEQISGPKVNAELFLGFGSTVLSPKQVHLLLELLEGFIKPPSKEVNYSPDSFPSSASPPTVKNKPLTYGDYKHIEGQLQSEASNYFSYDASNHDLISLDPQTTSPKSVHFHPLSKVSNIADSVNSDAFKSISNNINYFEKQSKQPSSSKTPSFGRMMNDVGNAEEVFRLEMTLIALSLVILHVEPVDMQRLNGNSQNGSHQKRKESSVDRDAYSYHHNLVSSYFLEIKKAFERLHLSEMFKTRSLFTNALNNHDHLRLLTGPLHIECERHSTCHPTYSKTKLNATAGNAEVLECLYDLNVHAQKSKSKCDCVELLIFPLLSEKKMPSMYSSTIQEHAVVIDVEHDDSAEESHTDVSLHLSSCKSEVDISIIDRLKELFDAVRVSPQVTTSMNAYSSFVGSNLHTVNDQALFQKAIEDNDFDVKSNKLDFSLASSQLHIEFRFPIPDLRPEIERRPWFKRSLRNEVLHLTAFDLKCETSFSGSSERELMSSHKKFTCSYKDLTAHYSDEVGKPAKLFLRTSQCTVDEPCSEGDCDLPFVEIEFQDQCASSQLNRVDDGDLCDFSQTNFSPHHSNSLPTNDDFPMLASRYNPTSSRIPSPFSQRKVVVFNNDEIILPGDEEEIQNFVDHTTVTSRANISLHLPIVQLHVPSKSFIESFYNRINNDLLLWEPAAPQPNLPPSGDFPFIPKNLDLESQFLAYGNNLNEIDGVSLGKSNMYMSFKSDEDEDIKTNDDESCFSKGRASIQKAIAKSGGCSWLTLSLYISEGTLSLCSDIKSEKDLKETGQIFLKLQNGSLFTVSHYLGNPNVDYCCIQITSCSLHHKVGLLAPPVMAETNTLLEIPPYLNPILYPNEKGVQNDTERTKLNSSNAHQMVTVVLKIELDEDRAVKQSVVAAAVSGLTLRHKFLPVGHSWLEQMIDIFDVQDTPVLGYDPPSYLTEVHFCAKECAIDYRPLYLKSRAVATLHSFALSSNIVANSPLSILQIAMDDVYLYIAENCMTEAVDLKQSFVNVLDIQLLQLCVKLSSQPYSTKRQNVKYPDLELIVSDNQIEMRTCADSCALLAALIRYIADNGDLGVAESSSEICDAKSSSEILQENPKSKANNDEHSSADVKNKTSQHEKDMLSLIEDAVKDDCEFNEEYIQDSSIMSSISSAQGSISSRKSIQQDLDMFQDDDDFCVIDDENLLSIKDFIPEVEYFKEHTGNICVVENYFAPVLGKTDHLRAPQHFPVPLICYTIKELSCRWKMFGGTDFSVAESSKRSLPQSSKDKVTYDPYKLHSKRSPLHSDRKRGGVNRNFKYLMEINVHKLRFQHEIYKPEDEFVSRTVFTITNFEILDRLHSSQINKFLYHFHNETSPKQSHANMLLVKALLVKPATNEPAECRLKVSMQPLRLNVDQDSLTFLTDFFASLSTSVSEEVVQSPDDNASTYTTAISAVAEPHFECRLGPEKETSKRNASSQSNVLQPIFFREFVFAPSVPIRLDYHGKHIDTELGTLHGLLMGLGQLNCSQLKLQKIVNRHGLLGFDKLINYALSVWADDVRLNQLPSILSGVGPMHSVVQFFQGFRDLVWLPVEQFRRDGRIVRGLQRGTSSFGTSTSVALLELTNRLVGLVQTTAETACDIITPVEVQKTKKQNTLRDLEKHARQKRQPNDLREGFDNAVSVVHQGVTDTANSIVRVAQKEHERTGIAGAVGGVLRHIPLTLVRPVAFASEATSNVLSGMRNQIMPDAKREDEDKWRAAITNK